MKTSFYTLILIISLFACRKKEPQPELSTFNKGCDCAKEVSADFEILELEKLSQFDPVGTDSDTIFHNKNVLFKAKEENADYTWYIGSEVMKSKEVGRYFSSAFDKQDITVSLVVKKKPNAICLPNDDGYDSITRTFYVQPYGYCDDTDTYVNDTTLLEGHYRMKSLTMADSFEVVIDYIDRQTALMQEVDIYNYDGEGGNFIGQPRCADTDKSYRQIWFNSPKATNYGCLSGYFHYRLDGVAEFIFTTCTGSTGNWTTVEHRLMGRKL
jgi:hypothetical protein